MDKHLPNRKLADDFVKGLLSWNCQENDRQMPWKGEHDPYKIWLSEVILQQTRVEQGLKYYHRFINSFPDVQSLAAAPEEIVFKHWEGLGYYSRCRNLLAAARTIVAEHHGVFPGSYDQILSLKGVGQYTAAAIASFAFNLPHAVLDGNVYRVLSRIFDIEVPIDSTEGRKLFGQLAQSMIPAEAPGMYNQAIMDFGATVCKPVPQCAGCFFNTRCRAFKNKVQLLLPVKAKSVQVKKRWLNYAVLQHGSEVAIRQRKGKDIWQELHEFFLVETERPASEKLFLQQIKEQLSVSHYHIIHRVRNQQQKLTHQQLHFNIVHLKLNSKPQRHDLQWIAADALSTLAFPKTLKAYIDTYLRSA